MQGMTQPLFNRGTQFKYMYMYYTDIHILPVVTFT